MVSDIKIVAPESGLTIYNNGALDNMRSVKIICNVFCLQVLKQQDHTRQ